MKQEFKRLRSVSKSYDEQGAIFFACRNDTGQDTTLVRGRGAGIRTGAVGVPDDGHLVGADMHGLRPEPGDIDETEEAILRCVVTSGTSMTCRWRSWSGC